LIGQVPIALGRAKRGHKCGRFMKNRECGGLMIAKTYFFAKTFHALEPKSLRLVKSLRDLDGGTNPAGVL
jgi:hypothetical protein